MRWPWVSCYRLEAAEKQIAQLNEQCGNLVATNAQLLELVQEEKEARREDRKKHEEKPEDSTTRKPRFFGAEVRKMATAAAKDRALKEGKFTKLERYLNNGN